MRDIPSSSRGRHVAAPPPASPRVWPTAMEGHPAAPEQVSSMNCAQFLDSYIVEETPEGLNIIDQHALHERILYERMKKQLARGSLNSQQLLVPELVELPLQEFNAVMEMRADLERFGFAIEPFGERTIIVRAFPQILGRFEGMTFFADLLGELESGARVDDRLESLLKVMACRGAVKAGERLSVEQILNLLRMRDATEQTVTCPHGRPTTIFLSRAELEKQFKRT